MAYMLTILGVFLARASAFQLAVDEQQMPVLPEDPWKENIAPRGDITRPRMLAMRGCSGSSAIMVYARSLLRLHGIPVPRPAEPRRVDGKPMPPLHAGWPAELMNPTVNWFYESAGRNMGKAMEMAADDMARTNGTLFFKGMIQHLQGTQSPMDEWNDVSSSLKELQVFAVLGSRRNMLDQIVCQIRDCFQTQYGVPVDAHGNESNLCFERRQGEGGGDYKAKLDVTRLQESLQREKEFVDRAMTNLKSIGIQVRTVYEEDLLDFQGPLEGAFERAVSAWNTLLRGFGVRPDEHVVKAFLAQHQNTYHEQPAHDKVIWNLGQVQKELHSFDADGLVRS